MQHFFKNISRPWIIFVLGVIAFPLLKIIFLATDTCRDGFCIGPYIMIIFFWPPICFVWLGFLFYTLIANDEKYGKTKAARTAMSVFLALGCSIPASIIFLFAVNALLPF
jgi:hypothetical protein